MRLIWHMVRKDLRTLRFAAVLLAVAVATKLAVGFWMLRDPASAQRTLFDQILVMANVAIGLEMAVTWIATALLVRSDTPIGTTAFWMSRPISGGRLLAAKLFAAGVVFAGVPVLVTLPWWLMNGFGLREVWLAALETALWQTLVVVPAMGVAVLTRRLKVFLAISVLAWGGLAAYVTWSGGVAGGVTWDQLARARTVAEIANAGQGLAYTRLALVVGAAVLGAFFLAAHQYLTRRWGRSAGFGAGLVAGIAGVALSWPWDLSGWTFPEALSLVGRDVKVSLGEAKYNLSGWSRTGDLYFLSPGLTAQLVIENLPANRLLEIDGVMTLTWPGGRSLRRGVGTMFATSFGYDFDSRMALLDTQHQSDPVRRFVLNPVEATRLLKGEPLWTGPGAARRGVSVGVYGLSRIATNEATARKSEAEKYDDPALLADPVYGRLRKASPAAAFDLSFRVSRQEGGMEIPFQLGSGFTGGGHSARIEELETDPKGYPKLTLLQTSPALFLDNWRSAVLGSSPRTRASGSFQLHDRARSLATALSTNGSAGRPLRLAGVLVMRSNLVAGGNILVKRAAATPPAKGWAGLTLVVTRYQTEATFGRSLATDRFEPRPPSSQAGVKVTGEVGFPGVTIGVGDVATPSVLLALRAASGLRDEADAAAVQLIRSGPDGASSIQVVDIEAYLQGRVEGGRSLIGYTFRSVIGDTPPKFMGRV
jgi:hypothetical protein